MIYIKKHKQYYRLYTSKQLARRLSTTYGYIKQASHRGRLQKKGWEKIKVASTVFFYMEKDEKA